MGLADESRLAATMSSQVQVKPIGFAAGVQRFGMDSLSHIVKITFEISALYVAAITLEHSLQFRVSLGIINR